MVESLVQRYDAPNLLPKLEANIRAGKLKDITPAVFERIEHGGRRPDEKMVETLCGLYPSAKIQLVRAVSESLSEFAEELDDGLVNQLASYTLYPTTGRTQQERARGRPRRSDREKLAIYVSYNILIKRQGYAVGQARRKIGEWIGVKPGAVAKIIRDWERSSLSQARK